MFQSSSFPDGFHNALQAYATFEHSPSLYPILVRSLRLIPEMGTIARKKFYFADKIDLPIF